MGRKKAAMRVEKWELAVGMRRGTTGGPRSSLARAGRMEATGEGMSRSSLAGTGRRGVTGGKPWELLVK